MKSKFPDTSEYYIRAFQRGEEVAYDYFFKLYFKALCFFARTILPPQHAAEDLVQDCFIRLWEKHWTIKNPDAIRSFLYSTVRYACIDLIRKKSVRISPALPEELPAEDANSSWEDDLIKAELLREIFAIVDELPGRVRQVVQLYYIDGKNDAQISQQLYTSPLTVRNQRLKAIKLLRGRLTRH